MASEPATTSPVARTGERTALPKVAAQRHGTAAERARQWSCDTDDVVEEEDRREQMDPTRTTYGMDNREIARCFRLPPVSPF